MGTRFALEALFAGKGDSLILHHGKDSDPRWILIDGGHHHIYENWLGPRLRKLRDTNSKSDAESGFLAPQKPLVFDMLMVSHADEDHVKGLLELLRHIEDRGATRDLAAVDFNEIWFNAFDDLLADEEAEGDADAEELVRPTRARTESVLRVASSDANTAIRLSDTARGSHEIRAVLASTKQGVELRDLADRLAIPRNTLFGNGLIRRQGDKPSAKLTPVEDRTMLEMTILGPDQDRIAEAREKWAEDLVGTTEPNAQLSSFDDKSPHNLASIMVLVEQLGKTMLLTGDGRGDHLVEGLEAQKLLKKDKKGSSVVNTFHVDLFKLPHHGSDNNTEQITFQKITADHYVISANGEHSNPMTETLDMLEQGRAAAGLTTDYTIYFTFPESAYKLLNEQSESSTERKRRSALQKLDTWIRSPDRPDHCKFVYRDGDSFGVTIDLA